MERTAFREAVFERDNGCCVVCGKPAVDAHHLMERRLWDDGGYHLDNGVSLCAKHHMLAEQTLISPEELREMAGIKRILLPAHLYRDATYDKWGNMYFEDGRRVPGELFYDESVQKVIEEGLRSKGLVIPDEFVRYFKYPRTYHLPWSPGATKDDRILTDIPWEGREVVITEKMDGENTSMYRDHIHARAMINDYHPSRNWVKNFHARFAHEIPYGWRLCGENLQAKHSIAYRDLPGYFMLFSVWDECNRCLSWDDTVEWSELLDIPLVPVLWEGVWNEASISALLRPRYSDEREGYIVRVRDAFDYRDFRKSVGKFVREGHVDETRHHWKREQMVPNILA